MSYGHRLNVEDVFFQMADTAYATAKSGMGDVSDSDKQGNPRPFRGPKSNEAVAAAVLAIVGWAIGLESFVNQAWNAVISPRMPSRSLADRLLRTLGTLEKITELLAAGKNMDPKRDQKPTWLPAVQQLFDLRNRFAHYKAQVSYQGFEFAPQIFRDLREDSLAELRQAVGAAIVEIAQLDFTLRTSFLDGDYQIAYDEP